MQFGRVKEHMVQLLAVCFRNSKVPSCCGPAHTITPDKLLSLLIKVARAKVRVQLSLMSRAFPGAHVMQGCSLMPAPLGAAAFTLHWSLPGTFAYTGGGLRLLVVNPSNGPLAAFMNSTGKIKAAWFSFPPWSSRETASVILKPLQEHPKTDLKEKRVCEGCGHWVSWFPDQLWVII